MKDLYKNIIDKLTNQAAIDLLSSRNLKKVMYVDLYKGQYQNQAAFDVMPLPAIFFEWSINHEEESASVNLHLVYEQVRDTSSRSESQEQSLMFFDYLNSIHELIKDCESVNTGKLETISFDPIQLDSIAIAHQLNYRCSYTNVLDKKDPYTWTEGDGELEFTKHIVKDFNFED